MSVISHSVRQVFAVVSFMEIGGFFLLLGMALLAQTVRFRRVALTARATVVGHEVEVREEGDDAGTYHHPQVTFLDAVGQPRTGTIRSAGLGSHTRFPVGKEIDILYDPADSGEVQPAGASRFWVDLCISLFIVGMCGFDFVVGVEVLLGKREVTW